MQTSTIWLSPKDFSNKDSSLPLLIETPSVRYPSTVVTCKKDPGDLKWVTMELHLPQNVIISEITVCYQLTSENSFICQIRLIEMKTPDHLTIRHYDATDLRSTSHACYTSKINGLVTTIETTMTLELGLNFLNKDDRIMLGAVGVKTLSSERSCVNVRDFGAVGGPDSKDASGIQKALDAVRINGGGTICIPAGTYHLEKTISIGDNVSLQGAGLDSTIICDQTEPGANFLLVSAQPVLPSSIVKNVRISGITFENGWAKEDGPTKGRDDKKEAIRAEKIDGLLIENCKFTEIEGFNAVAFKYARNVTVQRCQFYRWAQTGLFVGVESENDHVLDNVFDTAVSLTSPNTYTLGAGYEKTGEGSFYLKNLWVEHNIFLNNRLWSGITCHGGENIWIEYNYFANVRLLLQRNNAIYITI